MNKSEREAQHSQYCQYLSKARDALKSRYHREALEYAVTSWNYIDGTLQHKRHHSKTDFIRIETIDLVIKYAPPLFDTESLDQLAALAKSKRKIPKLTGSDLSTHISNAREQVWDAYRLWNYFEDSVREHESGTIALPDASSSRWKPIIKVWEELEIVFRIPEARSYRYSFQTSSNARVRAKCRSCGAVVNAAKMRLLEPQRCPKCHEQHFFVLLRSD